ncbi:MAG: DUF2520 domain-containing protein [Flavobacteriales bacterium]|nr:DUF2520 domain-containing protein [Flavobacteriales bacterium]
MRVSALCELDKKVSSNVVELAHDKRQRVPGSRTHQQSPGFFLCGEGQRLLRAADFYYPLKPLWRETAKRITELGPEEAFTGPARRGDIRTIKQLLTNWRTLDPIRDAYALLSKPSIMRAHGF